jgi:hypothetical protein
MTRAEKYYERSKAQGAFEKIAAPHRSQAANLESAATATGFGGRVDGIIAKTPCGEYVLRRTSDSWGPTALNIRTAPSPDAVRGPDDSLEDVPVMSPRQMWKYCGIF